MTSVSPTITVDREKHEARLNATHAAGCASAMEHFAKELLSWSGDAFAAHQDEKVKWYRDIASRAQEQAKKYRAAQKKHEDSIELTKIDTTRKS